MLLRAPRHPALRGVVRLLWIGVAPPVRATSERVIPTGMVHLAWRACGAPIRLGADGAQREVAGVVGGPRLRAHVHDLPGSVRSVGALLAPGAAPRVLGVPARALRAQHVGLDALWGAEATLLQERLGALDDEAALATVETALVARLRPAPALDLTFALAALEEGRSVREVAERVGRTTRTLRLWFDDTVGLSPLGWARVRRLQRALRIAEVEADGALVAHRAGYFDQAHLCREMQAIAGVTLGAWRRRAGTERNHVPLAASDSSKQAGGPPG